MSTFAGSTYTALTSPRITGLTYDVVPEPEVATSIIGGLITSYPLPELITLTFCIGP